MDNTDKQEVAKEVMALTIQQQAIEDFKKELQLAGASIEATNDLMNRVDISAIDFMGETRPVIKDANGQSMQSKDLISNLKEQLPSYFNAGTTETNGDVAPLSEHYLVDILQQIEAGELKTLDSNQKSAIRNCIKYLAQPVYHGNEKRTMGNGKYDAMNVYRIVRKLSVVE